MGEGPEQRKTKEMHPDPARPGEPAAGPGRAPARLPPRPADDSRQRFPLTRRPGGAAGTGAAAWAPVPERQARWRRAVTRSGGRPVPAPARHRQPPPGQTAEGRRPARRGGGRSGQADVRGEGARDGGDRPSGAPRARREPPVSFASRACPATRPWLPARREDPSRYLPCDTLYRGEGTLALQGQWGEGPEQRKTKEMHPDPARPGVPAAGPGRAPARLPPGPADDSRQRFPLTRRDGGDRRGRVGPGPGEAGPLEAVEKPAERGPPRGAAHGPSRRTPQARGPARPRGPRSRRGTPAGSEKTKSGGPSVPAPAGRAAGRTDSPERFPPSGRPDAPDRRHLPLRPTASPAPGEPSGRPGAGADPAGGRRQQPLRHSPTSTHTVVRNPPRRGAASTRTGPARRKGARGPTAVAPSLPPGPGNPRPSGTPAREAAPRARRPPPSPLPRPIGGAGRGGGGGARALAAVPGGPPSNRAPRSRPGSGGCGASRPAGPKRRTPARPGRGERDGRRDPRPRRRAGPPD